MLSRCTAFGLLGLEPVPVTVELDLRAGLPAFTIVGLADAAVRESRERVRAALVNCGFEFPLKRIVANLAPASLRKSGPAFDAALAAAVLAASEQIPILSLEGVAVHGELSLGGQIRPSRGTLAAAEGARDAGLETFFVADAGAHEAGLVKGIRVVPVADLRELAAVLSQHAEPRCPGPRSTRAPVAPTLDVADVRGQDAVLRALEISAAGGHNVLIEGPPGVGKTMLARRLPGIMPPLTEREALEVTRIHSIAGLADGDGLVAERPFRAPHHSVSPSGLVGGGAVPTPGEVTLAHRGVLFLDELPEFPRNSLEALRQPLEDGGVTVVRGNVTARFPASVTLVAAANPCPCGHGGGGRLCRCDERQLERHARKLSGPLLDRFDLLVEAGRPTADQLAAPAGRDSASVRSSVAAARSLASERWKGAGVVVNAEAPERLLLERGGFTPGALEHLDLAYQRGLVGPRGRVRLLRVSRTIADLAGESEVSGEAVLDALGLRLKPGAGE